MDVSISIAIAFAICFSISLLIAVPLHIAGYDEHVSKNGDLVETSCNVTGHYVAEATCHRPCNCITVCQEHCTTRHSNGRVTTHCQPQCSQRCQSCPYTCFGGVWTVEYRPIGSLMTLQATRIQGDRFDQRSSAEASLQIHPDGSSMICFYEQENEYNVRFERYDELGFYVSFIVFYTFAGAAFLGVVISLAVWAVKNAKS